MSTAVLFIFGTLGYVVLDTLQKTYAPSSYLEALDLSYGVDPSLNFRKVLTRIGFPFAVGFVLAFSGRLIGASQTDLEAVATSSTFLGATILVYPAFRSPYNRVYYVRTLNSLVVLTYVSFLVLNAVLGWLGARLIDHLLPLTVLPLKTAFQIWVRDHLLNELFTTLFIGVLPVLLWRLLVRLITPR